MSLVPRVSSSQAGSMGSWRRFDLNLKGVEGIQERTIGGGVVTLLSCCFVAFLLLSELSVWWTVDVAHRMHVDTDSVRRPLSAGLLLELTRACCSKTSRSTWTWTSRSSTRGATTWGWT